MAEEEGFEPPGAWRPLRFSSSGGECSGLCGGRRARPELGRQRACAVADERSPSRRRLSTEVS
jgi:hypothetical protein